MIEQPFAPAQPQPLPEKLALFPAPIPIPIPTTYKQRATPSHRHIIIQPNGLAVIVSMYHGQGQAMVGR